MDLEEIISLFVNNGTAIAVIIYFLWKDKTLTKENTEILQQVKAMLEVISNKLAVKEVDVKDEQE